MYGTKRLKIAARLIEAAWAEEALTWLAKCQGGYDDEGR